MKLRPDLPVILGVVALALALMRVFRPFGSGRFGIGPVSLIVILLLLGLRYAMRRQTQKRGEILKTVPKHPLGLADDPSDRD